MSSISSILHDCTSRWAVCSSSCSPSSRTTPSHGSLPRIVMSLGAAFPRLRHYGTLTFCVSNAPAPHSQHFGRLQSSPDASGCLYFERPEAQASEPEKPATRMTSFRRAGSSLSDYRRPHMSHVSPHPAHPGSVRQGAWRHTCGGTPPACVFSVGLFDQLPSSYRGLYIKGALALAGLHPETV